MAVFKCKMCGGTIEFETGATVGVCDSCGTKQTLPRLDDERRANLYDRANHFRRNNEFDKAAGIYEQILNEDNTDAEAYWSLVLCRYGIEYVEDPKTRKRIPTVNRAQFTSIYMDEDYKSALKYADAYQRQIYEEEAKSIDDIQKGILKISSKEEPFDVFICYKETDNNGKRTQDSVLATDLYHQLTLEGFKVFFAAITLEDKLGSAYEPYIFAALNSAKVMVVLGTKPEYFNAVWVKNEWSRYLSLVKNSGGKKVLIPAYKDMDPYDLPEEFSHLQAQDMAKLGFMQDLIRGIKKIISSATQNQTVKETVVVDNTAAASAAPLLERAFLFLEDGKWQDANTYCEKVLDINPKSAEAYLGKLMAELKVKTRTQLADCEQPFDGSENYSKIIRFGDEKLKSEIRGYISHINERNENARLIATYNSAVNIMQTANSEYEFNQAADKFRSISGFKDSDVLEKECIDKAEISRKDFLYNFAKSQMSGEKIENYQSAIETFKTISGWKDSDEKIYACKKKIEEIKEKAETARLEQARKAEAERLQAAREAEKKRIAAEKAAKKRKKVKTIFILILCIIIAFIILLPTVIIPNVKNNESMELYNKAMELYNSGNVVEAYEALIALDGYKDSAKKANSIYDKYKIEKFKVAKVGDYVFFGAYEQDNDTSNGKEDIKWIVLAKEDNKLLIISDKALDGQLYNVTYTNVTWETCSLRKWLNEIFLDVAFSAAEQLKIQSTNVSAENNPYWSTAPGNSTIDKVFLLSITEVNKYFTSDEARRCVPTLYAKANGVNYLAEAGASCVGNSLLKDGEAPCEFWLRSPGDNQDQATYVTYDGRSVYSGTNVDRNSKGVRPAMWISLDEI